MKNRFDRFAAALFLAALLSWPCGYALCEEGVPAKSLYTRGLELVQLMSEITRSEAYVELYTWNSDIRSRIQAISTGDFATPKAVYALSVSDEALADMAGLQDLSVFSEDLQTFLTQRMLSALVTQINSTDGAETLATASLCTVGKTFVDESLRDPVIYLYTFDEAVPVAVTFTVGEDQTVSASGMFILQDGFPCDSAGQIQTFFSDIPMEVTRVSEAE